jgi:putative heme iron utilization protein
MSTAYVFSTQEVTDIVDHMNDDHADALLLYVQAFCSIGSVTESTDVRMTAIDAAGINIVITADGSLDKQRITFREVGVCSQLSSRKDARVALVEMVRVARERLSKS